MQKSGQKCRGVWTRRRKGRGCGGANAKKNPTPHRIRQAARGLTFLFYYIMGHVHARVVGPETQPVARWSRGSVRNGERFTESPAWPPRGEPVIRKLRVPGRVRVAAKRKLLFIQRSYRCAMGARPFLGLVGAAWCCFSRLCEPTAGRSWPHARLRHVKKINACKNAGETAEPHGRGVEKVVVVAAPTRKYFSRRTGNAKQQPGSFL